MRNKVKLLTSLMGKLFFYTIYQCCEKNVQTGVPLARVTIKLDRKRDQHVSLKSSCGKR